MAKIVFYNEAKFFGGHERMAVLASKSLSQHSLELDISWVVHSRNDRLAAALEVEGIHYIKGDLDPTSTLLRNPLRVVRKIARISRLFHGLRPDAILIVQGTITDALDGVAAARISGIPFSSYLPMAHRWGELGLRRRGTALRGMLMSGLYRLTPRYITIDREQALRIQMQAPSADVQIVENYTPLPQSDTLSRSDARSRLGIGPGITIMGVVGRIEFVQKGQDWLVTALQDGEFLTDKLLLFIGDGADRSRLEKLISASPARDRMLMLGWRENSDEIYAALDLVILPSRMEGVPLAMLEALSRGIPVVGTDRDGMRSWLPEAWRFPFQDGPAMHTAINRALNEDHPEWWQAIEKHLAKATDYSRFGREFNEALESSFR